MERLPDETSMPARGGAGRNTVFALLTQFGTAGFTAVLTLYLVRALGPREFGLFSLAVSIGGLLYLPSDFGIGGSATRFIAERRGDRAGIAAVMSDALRLKLVIGAAVSGVTIALAGVIAGAYDEPALAWPIRWVAIALLFQSLVAFYRYAFTAQHEANVGFRIVLSESAVEMTASILLVAVAGGAAAAAGGRATGYAVGAAVAVVVTLRHLGRPAFARSRGRGVARRTLAGYAGAVFLMDLMFTTSIAAPLFYVPACLVIVRRATGLSYRPLLVTAARCLLAAAAMAAVLYAFGMHHLSPIEWVAGGVLGTAAFLAVIVVSGELTVAQLRALPRWVARRRRG